MKKNADTVTADRKAWPFFEDRLSHEAGTAGWRVSRIKDP